MKKTLVITAITLLSGIASALPSSHYICGSNAELTFDITGEKEISILEATGPVSLKPEGRDTFSGQYSPCAAAKVPCGAIFGIRLTVDENILKHEAEGTAQLDGVSYTCAIVDREVAQPLPLSN